MPDLDDLVPEVVCADLVRGNSNNDGTLNDEAVVAEECTSDFVTGAVPVLVNDDLFFDDNISESSKSSDGETQKNPPDFLVNILPLVQMQHRANHRQASSSSK